MCWRTKKVPERQRCWSCETKSRRYGTGAEELRLCSRATGLFFLKKSLNTFLQIHFFQKSFFLYTFLLLKNNFPLSQQLQCLHWCFLTCISFSLNAIYTECSYSYTETLVHACLRAARVTVRLALGSDTSFKVVTVNRPDAHSAQAKLSALKKRSTDKEIIPMVA